MLFMIMEYSYQFLGEREIRRLVLDNSLSNNIKINLLKIIKWHVSEFAQNVRILH